MKYTNVTREGDYFSIMNKIEKERVEIELCEKCAYRESCKIKKKIKANQYVNISIKQCKSFAPTLAFSVLDGLKAESFNTIRLSAGWGKRLKKGDLVFLHDSKNDKPLGAMFVKAVYTGSKEEMLEAHARYNHTCIDKNITNTIEHMEKVLIGTIGKNFYKAAKQLSVIYF